MMAGLHYVEGYRVGLEEQQGKIKDLEADLALFRLGKLIVECDRCGKSVPHVYYPEDNRTVVAPCECEDQDLAALRKAVGVAVKKMYIVSNILTKKRQTRLGIVIFEIATDLEQAIKAGEGNKQQGGKG